MIVDGRAIAKKIVAELKTSGLLCGKVLAVVAGSDPVTAQYLRIKSRVASELGVIFKQVSSVEQAGVCDGIIVQLPLPAGVDTDAVLNGVELKKDVDVLSRAAYEQFLAGTFPAPPVARAVEAILNFHQILIKDAHAVVVGQGRLVGRPVADLLRMRGARVTVVDKGDDVASVTMGADIVVLGAGVPELLRPEMIQEGVVIIDAGTSESNGKIVGDASAACTAKARLITPVPGGVGPVAVAELFVNLFDMVNKRM